MQFPPVSFRWRFLVVASCFLLTGFGVSVSSSPAADAFQPTAKLRRPIAVAFNPAGDRVLVANQRSGTISVIDPAAGQVTAEHEVARHLSDLTMLDGGRYLAADDAAHEVVLFSLDGGKLTVDQRVAVSPYPVEIAVDLPRRRAYVSSLWSRRLTVLSLAADADTAAPVSVDRVLDLDFPPRKLALVADGSKLLVADAFVGRLDVLDTMTLQFTVTRRFYGHNIRGLAESADGRMLLIAHQMLNDLAHTVGNDVHWGLLMSNDIRWLKLDHVLDASAVLYAGGHMHPLGEANDAAADPNEVAVRSDGVAVVAIGGVDQIAVGREDDFRLDRYRVGRRPTAVAIAPDGQTAAVANTLDDSITLFAIDQRRETARVALGPSVEPSLVDRGESLFYDGRLSLDGWMSCHSCHTDGHTNGLLNDNLSDFSFGAAKRVLSLFHVADTAPYAWNGSADTLPGQIRNSVTKTMQGRTPPSDEQTRALAAYLQSLTPPESVDRLRGVADDAAFARGRKVFESRDCQRCHAPPLYTTPQTYDVGLTDKEGNRRFNPPSLLGLSQRGPYFHDNRADTLTDVLVTFGHPDGSKLQEQELADLLAFLRNL